MPTSTDLMGLGMAAQLAESLGNTNNALTCTGTAIATAATIKTHNTELVAASSQTGAKFPSTAKVGTPYYLFNSTATSAVIYVPSGMYINTVLNDSYTLAQNKSVIMLQYKPNYWSTNLTA